MKSAKSKLSLIFLSVLACLLISSLVYGAIVYDLSPSNLYRTTSTSVFFDWEVNTTSLPANPMPSYLFISDINNESSFALNYTLLYCLNGSSCNTTVTGFSAGFYQWYVITGDAALSPSVVSSNAQSYDTSDRAANVTSTVAPTYDTRDRAANITSTIAETFNTLDRAATLTSTAGGTTYNTSEGNVTVDMTYTNGSGTIETCNVTLENNEALPVANVTAAFNSACNLTASGTGNFTLTTEGTGITQFIYIDDGNATVTLGLTNLTAYNGTANNTLNIRYTNGTVEETCNVTLSKRSDLTASDVIDNITQASAGCNLTTTDVTYVNVNTILTGADEWIIFETGTANEIIGFTTDLNVTGSTNNTINMNYTLNGATETCVGTLSKSATLSSADAVSNITRLCNVTGTDVNTGINLNTNTTGDDEFIIFDVSSAAGILGFTINTNYTGTVNNSFDLTYMMNGTVETCNVTLTKDSQLNATEIISNMTQADTQCNLTVTNTTFLNISGSGYGEKEYITFDRGNVLSILGYDLGTTYGSQTNVTSDSYWFEILDTGVLSNHTLFTWENESGNLAMTLNKDNGDLWVQGTFTAANNLSGNLSWDSLYDYPSSCPSGAVTTIGDTITCTDSWVDTLGETDTVIFNGGNVTNMSMINILPQSAAPGTSTEGDIYYDSDINDLCIHNGTGFFGALTNGACT